MYFTREAVSSGASASLPWGSWVTDSIVLSARGFCLCDRALVGLVSLRTCAPIEATQLAGVPLSTLLLPTCLVSVGSAMSTLPTEGEAQRGVLLQVWGETPCSGG